MEIPFRGPFMTPYGRILHDFMHGVHYSAVTTHHIILELTEFFSVVLSCTI